MRWGVLLGVLGGVLYVGVCVAAWTLQRDLIYRPDRLTGVVGASAGAAEEIVTFPSGDGVRISGAFRPARDERSPFVLVAHGNAGNVLTWLPYLETYRRLGCGALLLDPRGYGWSDGTPSEEGWHRDADAALAWLGTRGVPSSRVVVVGVSIGTGVAVPLAAGHPVRGLILESPFTSLVDVAADHFPFLPCGWLIRDRFDSVSAAPRVRCPVLILHGTRDRTIPPDHARRLAAAFSPAPTLRWFEGADHNDLSVSSGHDEAIGEFLRRLP